MANNDIFGYTREGGKTTFSSANSILTTSGTDAVGLLIQDWRLTYQQTVQEVFELGGSAVYWSKGRPVGQGSIKRIIGARGPTNSKDSFLGSDAYDACSGGVKQVKIGSASGGCSDKKNTNRTLSFVLQNVIVTSVGYSASVSSTMVNEDISFKFVSMNIA